MSLRRRPAVAAFCIALVVFTAFLPVGVSDTVWAALIPVGLVVSLIGVTTIARTATQCDEQTVAPLSLVLLRAPPAHPSLS